MMQSRMPVLAEGVSLQLQLLVSTGVLFGLDSDPRAVVVYGEVSHFEGSVACEVFRGEVRPELEELLDDLASHLLVRLSCLPCMLRAEACLRS